MMDYDTLTKLLREMQPRQKMYELIKAEMIARGRWKAKPRGKAFNKGRDSNRKKQ
jgi:hypothetical protein